MFTLQSLKPRGPPYLTPPRLLAAVALASVAVPKKILGPDVFKPAVLSPPSRIHQIAATSSHWRGNGVQPWPFQQRRRAWRQIFWPADWIYIIFALFHLLYFSAASISYLRRHVVSWPSPFVWGRGGPSNTDGGGIQSEIRFSM